MDNQSRRKHTRTTRTTLVDPTDVENCDEQEADSQLTDTTTTTSAAAQKMGKKSIKVKEREKKIKRVPIKERWLLTRKTWKYMTDAGRRLIPEGVSNRTEDLQKIEEYFQHVCRNEPKFLPWHRKASYPGAMASFRRKGKSKHGLLATSPPKASSADEAEDEKDDGQRLLVMIKMLERFLSIKESAATAAASTDNSQLKALSNEPTTTATGTTNHSSDEEYTLPSRILADHRQKALIKELWFKQSHDNLDYQQLKETVQQQQQQHPKSQSKSSMPKNPSATWTAHSALLLESLRNYSKTNSNTFLSHDRITADMLHDKRLLRQIRDELKQQQLMRLLRRHSSRSSLNIIGSTSSSANLIDFWQKNSSCPSVQKDSTVDTSAPTTTSSYHLKGYTPSTTTTMPITTTSMQSFGSGFSSFGTSRAANYLRYVQTDPIPINVIYQLYDRLIKSKLKLAAEEDSAATRGQGKGDAQQTAIGHQLLNETKEQSSQQQHQGDSMKEITATKQHSRRKSSIDNEDVSQSVSDTIKRYLRMARKKATNDNDANRFKRVNYDKHQVRAQVQREPTPPPDNTISADINGTTKSTQTDPNWIVNVVKQIQEVARENVSPESTDEEYYGRDRDRVYFDYSSPEIDRLKSSSTSPTHSSPPSPSPSGLFHSSTQFLTNLLWHTDNKQQQQQHQHQQQQQQQQQQPQSTTNRQQQRDDYNNSFPALSTALPLASSSSSPSSPLSSASSSRMQKSKSSSSVGPSFAKKIWKSRSKSQSRTVSPAKPHWMPQGNCVWTSASGKKIHLTPIPLRDLTEVERKSLHRVAIDRINQLNLGVSVNPPDEHDASIENTNKPQKKRPMLLKRKALTTGFFDTTKSKNGGTGSGGGEKRESGGRVFGLSLEKCVDNDKQNKQETEHDLSSELSSSRNSRNSLSSLSEINRKTAGSYESLPSRGLHFVSLVNPEDGIGKNLISSISHTDVRRDSQDDDESVAGIQRNQKQQVPALVQACVNHLLKYGLNQVGIFRVSTSKRRVRQLREEFDSGSITTLDEDVSAHDSASLLKEFLRDLPEPLLCTNLYHAFVQTQKIRNRRLQLEALSHLIQLLPVAHRDTLYVLLKFLATIAKQAHDQTSPVSGTIEIAGNKMDSANLATVIAPNILHLNKLGQSTAETERVCRLDVINVTRIMIDHFEELFIVSAEVLDDIYTTMMDMYPEQLNYLCERKNILNRDDFGSQQQQQLSMVPQPQTASFSLIYDSENDAQQQQQQRVYTRQDFMHENAAKGDTNGTDRRRERSSKMKYQEADHEITRRRRRERQKSSENDGGVMSSLDQSQSQSQSSFIHSNPITAGAVTTITATPPATQTAKSTKSGSITQMDTNILAPLLQHGDSGIVSASFRLPVQVQIHDIVNPTLNLTADHQNIPYIEDGNCYGNESPGIHQTELSSQKLSVSNQAIDNHHHHHHHHQYLDNSQTVGSATLSESHSSSSREPKITASISNIGGAVLRSKTADFERLLKQNNKRQTTTTTATKSGTGGGGEAPSASGDFSASASTSGGSSHLSDATKYLDSGESDGTISKRSQPIYKRKEIISSAQTPNK